MTRRELTPSEQRRIAHSWAKDIADHLQAVAKRRHHTSADEERAQWAARLLVWVEDAIDYEERTELYNATVTGILGGR